MYKNVVILDDNVSGHHGIYLCAISEAFAKLGFCVTVFSPILPSELSLHKGVDFVEFNITDYQCGNEFFFNKFRHPYLKWKHADDAITSAGLRSIDTFVFFNWLDDYAFGLMPALVHRKIFKYNASGILFKNHFIRESNLLKSFLKFPYALRSKRFSTVTFVENSHNIKAMGNLLGKKTFFFPDFINSEEYRIDHDFEQRACKNLDPLLKTIGIIGALSKRKNALYLIRNSQELLKQGLQVLLVGRLSREEYSSSEISEIQQICNQYSNIHLCDEFIPNESTVNSIYQNVDIVWAAYQDWPFTSNAVSKAVFYNKLSVVPDNSYLSEVVDEYKIGISIDTNKELSPQILMLNLLEKEDINFRQVNVKLDVESLPNLLLELINE